MKSEPPRREFARFGSAIAFAGALTLALSGHGARAGDWPGWRGPRGDGTSDESDLPVRWNQTENVVWRVPIPGKGHSSPVVWGNRVFVTSCVEEKQERLLLCLDRANGRTLWQRVVLRAPLEPKHSLNSYASSTPATDGRHVWVSFLNLPRMEVYCYDVEGTLVWQRSPGEFHSRHGFCSPPVLYKDLVILNGDQDAEAYLVALDKETGAERWRADRPNRTRSYVPPLVIEAAGRPQLALSGNKCVAAYEPDTGRLIWLIDGPTEQFVASLVYAEGVLCMTAGFPEYHLMGIRPDGKGNVTRSAVVWHERRGAAYVPSPVACGPYFFVVSDRENSDNGKVSCFEAKTGNRRWAERLGRHFSASPVAAGGNLYFLDDDGTTHVLKAGPEFELVSRNALGEPCRASPAVAHGQLFIRGADHLYCIGKSG
jgi:outer membrane protein assembly factor BamB